MLVRVAIGLGWRHAETGSPANSRLEPPPGRPHERLVVEGGWDELLEEAVNGAEVEFHARVGIYWNGFQALDQLDLSCLEVRHGRGTGPSLDDRVWLLEAGSE